MSMQGLAASSQIQAGFALLERAENCGLLFHCDDHCYPMFFALVQACRTAGDSNGASRVQAAMNRLGMIALAAIATARVQGSWWRYQNGVEGMGVAEAWQFWLELEHGMAYKPQLQVLPWAFVQMSTREQQEGSLQQHAEKKALAVLLSHGEATPGVFINFNACMDCHEFFKISSQLLSRRILLYQPKMTHMFTDGHCSCNDRWSLESRLGSAVQTIAVAVKGEQKLDAAGAQKKGKTEKHAAAAAVKEEQHLDAVEDRGSNIAKLMAAAAVEESQHIPTVLPLQGHHVRKKRDCYNDNNH